MGEVLKNISTFFKRQQPHNFYYRLLLFTKFFCLLMNKLIKIYFLIFNNLIIFSFKSNKSDWEDILWSLFSDIIKEVSLQLINSINFICVLKFTLLSFLPYKKIILLFRYIFCLRTKYFSESFINFSLNV